MRLIQYVTQAGKQQTGVVNGDNTITPLNNVASVYELASKALHNKVALVELIHKLQSDEQVSYDQIITENRLLSPYTHKDPAHLYVTGTGLTHLGSADTRATMHAQGAGSDNAELTDSMKMFKAGVERGKPKSGEPGAQPEWFYKGNGSIIVQPGQTINSPHFALDAGEEPEIAGLYINDENGQPYRIGFALGNEFSDHITEKENYLLLAHSKLRQCAIGPEIFIGELPTHIEGYSRIIRDGKVLWEKPFLSGEDNMSHSIENLEHHHFKYPLFRNPGDAHVHFFGTATLSFGDGVSTQAGDTFEIVAEVFGRPLRNELQIEQHRTIQSVTNL
ncbi:AraD1 family protein [Aliidiomarina soli]|uniref:FAH family protein n=1 Tax=Aliidiomarina soli TaxID=1928574 RepID=A0A432WF96_9GAMM|nr:AraD1 family protein [Aliidiomarina soli]RUO32435.1 FAH family protein [Aliidiomarina soli]